MTCAAEAPAVEPIDARGLVEGMGCAAETIDILIEASQVHFDQLRRDMAGTPSPPGDVWADYYNYWRIPGTLLALAREKATAIMEDSDRAISADLPL